MKKLLSIGVTILFFFFGLIGGIVFESWRTSPIDEVKKLEKRLDNFEYEVKIGLNALKTDLDAVQLKWAERFASLERRWLKGEGGR